MKLNNTNTPDNWRDTFHDSVQVAFTDIPTGEIQEVYDEEEQREKKVYVTEERIAFGFQTETGRGKGVQWIPVEDVDPVLDRLEHYAANGVDAMTANDEWLTPAESIDETITRVKREDGGYDIAFRVRLGKGSKSCKVPESDFAEFVSDLKGYRDSIPGAVEQVVQAREAAERKAREAAEAAASEGDESDE